MSALTYNEQSDSPGTPAAGKVNEYYLNTNPPLLAYTDDAGGIYLPSGIKASSIAAVSASFATDIYLVGSGLTVPKAGMWKAQTQYYCVFDMTKTGAGTGAFTVNVRMGTLGTTGDASVLSLAFAVGTAVIDAGTFELFVNFRTVGAGTSAVVSGLLRCTHHLAATGLITTGASGTGIVLGTGAGFNSSTQTKIGISVNGGASFSGTNTIVQSALMNI